jgi:FHA domain
MIDSNNRTPRKVAIAEHIWTAFDEMAGQMGSDRDALINQAMFMFARLNGFLDGSASQGSPAAIPASNGAPVRQPSVFGAKSPAGPSRIGSSPSRVSEPSGQLDEDPARREVAERVLETAAELERLIKGKNQSPAASLSASDSELEVSGDSASMEGEEGGDGNVLYMMMEGGELDRIAKERFVIGRGKHCDFVINSGKVSREHAQILKDGDEYFLEDLGSSNGTWFNKQRIKRRKIEDGDEYFICSEKVKFVYR